MTNFERRPQDNGCAVAELDAGFEVIEPRDVPLGGPRAMTVRRTLPSRHRSLIGAFCFADHYGPDVIGALTALRAAGRRVPDDVAVGGFDDTAPAAGTDPPLTTMRQPFGAISAEMVDVVLDMVEGAGPRFVTMPAELVVRAST